MGVAPRSSQAALRNAPVLAPPGRPDAASGSARACMNRLGGARMRTGSGAGAAVIHALMRFISTSGYPNTTPSAATAAASVALTVRDGVIAGAVGDARHRGHQRHRLIWMKGENARFPGVLAHP
jgi:hypothetical protein